MKSYKEFARYYDAIMGEQHVAMYKSHIDSLFSSPPEGKSILDLGCGTGTLLSMYSKTNRTVGIDGSSHMMALAKKKDPHSRYIHHDISKKLPLNEKFDLITLSFDTINHLQGLPMWKNLLKNAHSLLKDSGYLIFDFNTQKKFKRLNEKMLLRAFRNGYFILHTRLINPQTTCWHVLLFVKTMGRFYTLHEETITEYSYPTPAVLQIVRQNYALKKKLSLENGGRIMCICKKLP